MASSPRHPNSFTFLKWFGPAVAGAITVVITLVIAASEVWASASSWAEALFLDWYPVLTSPWFLLCTLLLIGGYIGALVYTGLPARGAQYSLDNLDGLARALGAPPTPASSDWMPMHKALSHIALKSSWAFGVTETDVRKLDEMLEREVLEHLARGELSARGIEYQGTNDFTSSTTPIPKEFWETAFIQPFGEIVLVDDNRCVAARNGRHMHVPRRSYRHIIFDKQRVLEIWPKAAPKHPKHKTIFHFALIAYYQNDGDNQKLVREMKRLVASYDEFQ